MIEAKEAFPGYEKVFYPNYGESSFLAVGLSHRSANDRHVIITLLWRDSGDSEFKPEGSDSGFSHEVLSEVISLLAEVNAWVQVNTLYGELRTSEPKKEEKEPRMSTPKNSRAMISLLGLKYVSRLAEFVKQVPDNTQTLQEPVSRLETLMNQGCLEKEARQALQDSSKALSSYKSLWWYSMVSSMISDIYYDIFVEEMQ